MKSTRLATLCVALGLASFFNSKSFADTYTDPSGETINSAGGTIDFIGAEVTHDATDVTFKLTVNGNITTTDWGNFMIGIATGKGGSTGNTKTGNGWNRPINLDAGANGGMTHWIGSWVNGGGGSQIWSFSAGAWSQLAGNANHTYTAGATSTLQFKVSRATLGVNTGDTIYFDAYSSGGGGGDSAVDSLANPNTSITGWGGPYTSSAITGLLSYQLGTASDADSDGLPDDWETLYGLSISSSTGNDGATGDPDSDNLTNAGELAAGTNPTVADTDNDGLNDGAEVTTHTTNPLVADTDGDGANDGAEITAGTNPKKRNYATITLAGTFNGFTPDAAGDASNVMTKDPAVDPEFGWSKRIRATGEAQLRIKFTAGSWATQWGSGSVFGTAAQNGGDISALALGTGFFDITFNNDTLAYTLTRVDFSAGTYADFSTAYGLATGSESADADGDGLTNSLEQSSNTDPLNPDSDGDGLADGYDPARLATPFAIDGIRDDVYLNATGTLTNGPATNSVQTTTALTGSNALANLAIRQVSGKLHLFVGGTPLNTQAPGSTDGTKNHFLLFIDSKAGGVNQFASNTINTNNNSDASQVNGLAGMKLESGFEADYVIKITGGTNNAWVNVHNLQSGTSYFVGESATGIRSGDVVSQIRSSFPATSSSPYADVTAGTEMVLDLAALGVNLNTTNPASLKFMALLASEDSRTGYDQVLPPAPAGVTTLSATDFNAVTGSQTLVFQPKGLPVLTVSPSSLFSSLDDLSGGDPYPGTAVDAAGQSITVFSDFDAKMETISGSATVTYRAVDPATGWFSTVTRTVVDGSPSLNFANLQFPTNAVTINTLGRVEVFARVGGVGVTDGATAVGTNRIPGFRAQIGISANTNSPATDTVSWTWTDAAYEGERDLGREDYKLIFSNRPVGTYYYASRFSLNGGTNWTVGVLGGAWQEGTTTSAALGTFTVENVSVNYANVQWPPNGTLAKTAGLPFQIFAQAYVAGVTEAAGAPTYSGFKAQIGTSIGNNDPAAGPELFTWSDAIYSEQVGSNDQYVLEIAAGDVNAGTYYYASRFSVDNGVTWSYGGIKADGSGGGPWGGDNVNGVLRVGNVPSNLALATSSLPENNATGAVIGGFTTSDDDSGDTFTYTLVSGTGSTDNGLFTIDGANLKAAGVFDFEARNPSSYNIRVRTTDPLGFSYEKAFTITVTDVNETPAGSTFAGWAGSGTATNSELVGKYAIGGAANLSGASEKPVSAVDSNTLSLSAIVRTNDTNLTVVGEAGGSLTNWSTNGVSMTPSTNTSGVPEGHQRQVFSVDRTNSPTRQFLRLKATLAP